MNKVLTIVWAVFLLVHTSMSYDQESPSINEARRARTITGRIHAIAEDPRIDAASITSPLS